MRDTALAAGAFERWLMTRKPLCETALFQAAGLRPPPLPPWERAGVEATLSLAIRAFGLRRARYAGLAKVRLQHAARNLARMNR